MFKGFYNLTSGMITQGRVLDVISNNMTNVSTAGYKEDRLPVSTFEDAVWNAVGNMDRNYRQLGEQSWITMPSRVHTNMEQGSLDETGLTLDFAIDGDGWFCVLSRANVGGQEAEEGAEDAEAPERRVYTRNGNFALDAEGYLSLPGQGRGLSAFEEPIQLSTDTVDVDVSGRFYAANGAFLGQLGVFAFDGGAELEKDGLGMFTTEAQPQSVNARILQGELERSNVDWTGAMVQMMAAQRAYQSAAGVIKIYDDVIQKAAQDVGRLA